MVSKVQYQISYPCQLQRLQIIPLILCNYLMIAGIEDDTRE